MAKLEIPSIVVHSGSPSVPGVSMERTARQTPQLRKQKSSIDDGEAIASGCIHHHQSKSDSGGTGTTSSTSSSSNISQTKGDISSGGGASCKPGSPGGTNSRSDDVDKAPNGPQPQLSRSRSNAKMKMLTRSHAMREATSPPPDPAAIAQMSSSASSTATTQVASTTSNQQSAPASVVNTTHGKSNGQASKANNNNNNHSGSNHHHHTSNNNNFKNKNGNNKISKDQNISSNRASNHRAQQNKNYIYISSPQEAWGGLLSQDYSTTLQCQDAAKADLLGFIAAQMTTKNRALLLRVEEELKQLVQDQRPIFFRFPQMTSFHRMLVHRAATYFQMDHNLDASGTCVIVNRNKSTRMPERTFFQVMKDMKGLNARAYSSEEPRKSILKRDYASFEDNQFKSDEKQLSLESRRSKSFEEREEEYERARRRIFSRDDSTESCQRSESNQDSMEDVRWSECATWPCDEPEPPGRYLRPNDRPGRLMKTESYESRDTSRSNSSRSAVSKSYSFGGYTGNGSSNGRLGPSPSHGQSFAALPRGDSNASSLSAGSRVLAKQDSGSSASSRLSPSSSGYKSQSQQSDATLSATPSPTATPLSLLPMSSQGSQDTLSPEPPVIWPMTSMGNIPPGSVLINPATGQPICNADGSVYRYDPENPLTLHVPVEGATKSPPTSQSGRLSDDCAKSNTPEQETSWANQSSQSPKVTSNTPSPKLEASKPASQQPPPKAASQFDKPQSDKATSASDQSKPTSQNQNQNQNQPEKRSYSSNNQSREEHRGSQGGKGAGESTNTTTSSTTAPSASSLSVPERTVTNTATSPMLVAAPSAAPCAAPSPQRPLPLVVGAPGAAAAPPPPQPQAGTYPLPMVAYPVQPPQPHYPNGSYAYAAAPPADGQAFYGGAVPAVPYMGGYALDPATGSYVPQPQQTQQPPPPPGQPHPVGPAPPPCCLPGYPCMYAAPAAGPPPPGPHSGYDHRGSDVTGQAVNEVTGYMIGMSLNGNPGGPVVDQRAGGDGGPGPAAARHDGQSPLQGPGPGGPPTPHIMVAGNGSYYWGPQISSQNQGYPPTVMYYYPPNNVTSPQNPTGVAAGSAPASGNNSNSNYNRGTSPHTNNRDNSNSKNSSNSSGSTSSSSPGSNSRNSYSRNVAASYAKGAAIFQPPAYSMPNMAVAPQTQDRTVINGYPNDCVGVAPPQQQVVYTVSSMHTSTVPTQSYQPSVYSNANLAMTGSGAPPGALAYYQGAGDGPSQAPGQPQGQPLVPLNPYAGPGYMPAPGTPPITQTSYGVHPYVYGMYSQTANGPGGPTSPANYPNVTPHQSPLIQRMMRPNLSSPPPRTVGPKGFPRGQSPGTRKDHGGSGDNIRFSQPYSMPMYNLAASRYMSTGDMRYMAGRLPFSIPTNSYHRAIRPFQTSYYPRPHSQPSGEALSLTRPPRVRKPTPQARSPARGPFVGREFNAYSKPPAVMRTS